MREGWRRGSKGERTWINNVVKPFTNTNNLQHHPKLRTLLLRHAERPASTMNVPRILPHGLDTSLEKVETISLSQVLARCVVVDLVELFDVVDLGGHERETVFIGRGRIGVDSGGGDVFVVPEGPDVGEGGRTHAFEHVELGGFAVDGLGAGCGGDTVFGDGGEAVELESWAVGSHGVDCNVGAFFGGLAESFLDRQGHVAVGDGGGVSVGVVVCIRGSKLGSDQVAEFLRIEFVLLGNLVDSGIPVLAEGFDILLLI